MSQTELDKPLDGQRNVGLRDPKGSGDLSLRQIHFAVLYQPDVQQLHGRCFAQ